MEHILKHYQRKDIQKALIQHCTKREVAIKYGDRGYGKRPDTLQFEGDIAEVAKNGATSFHISEERWQDPLSLKTGMTRKQLDELRIGWDLLLDIDSNFVEYSQLTGKLLVDALEFHDITTIGVKFSGRSGIHLMVPFESFPTEVNKKPTKLLFPEGTKAIANYLKTMIEKPLREEILSRSTITEIMKATGKPMDKVTKDKQFNPFVVVDIDPILISSRHLFRSPYSFNEKSGLVSIPIKKDKIMQFKITQARHDRVETEIPFIDTKNARENEAQSLLIQAFDWNQKNVVIKQEQEKYTQQQESKKEYTKPVKAITAENFPPCILQLLQGVQKDGRKRAVFILLNFLHHAGYDQEGIKKIIREWNQRNYEPLNEGYILAQVDWQRRQKNIVLPPNCSNISYYQDLGICHPDNLCSKIKNPVQYATRKVWAKEQHEKGLKKPAQAPKIKRAKKASTPKKD